MSLVKNRKSEHHQWILLHIGISLSTKFLLKLKILIFLTKFVQKGISGQKRKKWISPLYSAYSNYSEYQISLWTNNFEFCDQICLKRVFSVENEKSKHHHWILHTRISLGTKFHFKQTILNFGTKFSQKGYFRIFKLV